MFGLLAALVVTSTFADGQRWSVGAHTVGVALAGVLLWRGRSLVLAVAVAVVVTALLRALTDVKAQDHVRDLVLSAYARFEAEAVDDREPPGDEPAASPW